MRNDERKKKLTQAVCKQYKSTDLRLQGIIIAVFIYLFIFQRLLLNSLYLCRRTLFVYAC